MPSERDMSEPFLHPAMPAATLVLFRTAETSHPPQHLMVERSATMAFAAGALAFPGGKVDADDHMLGAQFGAHLDTEDAAARVAAIRETLEESGLAVGFTSVPGEGDRRALRDALHAGNSFSALLAAAGLSLALDQLEPFARWRPNFAEARIFDARFYIAAEPAGQTAELINDAENSALFWASAAETLARANRGEARIIFPTRRNLERLATYGDFDAAMAHARAHDPHRMITPWTEDRDGVPHLCIPDDLGYPVTAEAMGTAERGGR
jgi:8-oxo-dGTP pyrophosphatase MutT (NUDIX family)